MWKKDTLNLYVFKREWEVSEDAVLNELWNENQRLEKLATELKSNVNKLELRFVFTILLLWIILRLGNLFSKSDKTNNRKTLKKAKTATDAEIEAERKIGEALTKNLKDKL